MGVPARLLILFAFSSACEITLAAMAPELRILGRVPPHLYIALSLGVAAAPFIGGGILPVTYWAFRGFSSRVLNGVTIAWALLILLFVYLQFFAFTGDYMQTGVR